MWGNRFGWGISALIVILVCGLLALVVASDRTSAPSKFLADGKNLGTLELPVSPKTVVAMNDGCNAGDLYRQAIADYKSNEAAYEKFRSSGTLAQAGQLKGIQLLVQAAPCANMALLSNQLDDVVTYQNEKPQLEALRAIGHSTIRVGLLSRAAKNEAEARKHYEAAFALGAKLYNERVVYVELQLGLEMMSTAGAALAGLEGDRAAAAKDFIAAYEQYNKETIIPMWTAISTIDDKLNRYHAGDIPEIARNSKETMWRTEAALKLGRMQHRVGGDVKYTGDVRGSRRLLRQLAEDPDPAVKLAAQRALALTAKDYNMLR